MIGNRLYRLLMKIKLDLKGPIILCVGVNNRNGQPHEDTMERLVQGGTKSYNTDEVNGVKDFRVGVMDGAKIIVTMTGFR